MLTRFKFRTTDDLKSLVGVIEQDRAVRALELGLSIDNRNYNVYVAGSSGTGKTTVLKTILAKIAPKSPTPSDWIYVHNFRDPSEPHAIEMAPGEANRFRHRLRDIIAALREQIPQVFHAKEHQETIQGILNEGLDQENECGYTPLHLATQKGHFEVVRFLCTQRAASDTVNKKGFTPLHSASERGHPARAAHF